MHAIELLAPLLECVGIGFHLVLEDELHRRRTVDQAEYIGELSVGGIELLERQIPLSQPVFGFMVAHD